MSEAAAGGLQRLLGPTGVTLLTLSALSPGASVLVAGGDILHQAGTGAALAFLFGGILTLVFTFAQAELAALGLIAGLGFLHPARSLAAVFASPAVMTASASAPLSLGALGLAIAAASWATSGAGQAIYFSEEMHAPKSVGRLVIGIVLLTVIFELLPVLGIVIGAGDLRAVFSNEAPFIAFFAEGASPSMATLLTLGIIAALFNALVSGITCYGRFVYSSGRDRIWSDGINRALVRVHPRSGSPWVATIVFALSGLGCCFLGLSTLIVLAAGCGIAQWVLLNVAGIVGRMRGLTGGPGTYRAPLFPLTHVLSLFAATALAVIAWNDTATGRPGMIIVLAAISLSLLYHRFVLDRRAPGWTMVSAADPA